MNIKKIIIEWSEACNDKPQEFTSFETANKYLRQLAERCESDLGYYKTKFVAEWEDGFQYEGRYDLHRWDQKQENPNGCVDLFDHIKGVTTFYSGKRKPLHMDDDQYNHLLQLANKRRPGISGECTEIINKYLMVG